VGLFVYGFCNVWVCVIMGFVKYVGVGFVMCGFINVLGVYIWVL